MIIALCKSTFTIPYHTKGEGRERGGGRARLGHLSRGARVPSYATGELPHMQFG